MQKFIFSLALATIVSLFTAVAAQADLLFGFGDSLVDNGNISRLTGQNIPPSPPYLQNRFSNGPTFVEYLPKLLSLHADSSIVYGTGYNLAVGGAESGSKNFLNPLLPGLVSEINLFSSLGRRFESRDLAIVWAGANDYFDLTTQIQNGAIPLTQLRTVGLNAMNQTTSNLADAAMRLADLGVKRMVFANLPDLGKIPQLSGTPLLSAPATQLTDAHNQQLESKLARVHAQTGANIILFDANLVFKRILADPAKYGFSNVTDAAINTVAMSTSQSAQNTYLFWDNAHPTTAGHLLLARYIVNMVEAPSLLASQIQLMTYGSRAFADLIYSQLTSYAGEKQGVLPSSEGKMVTYSGKGVVVPPPPNAVATPNNRTQIFLLGGFRQGQRADRSNSVGFNYYLGNVALGAQYTFNSLISAGALLGYGYNKSDLNEGQGHIDVNAYQVGGFLNFHGQNWCVGGIAAYGFNEHDSKRHGILGDTITGSPNGHMVILGTKGGYFWRFGDFAVGPTGD